MVLCVDSNRAEKDNPPKKGKKAERDRKRPARWGCGNIQYIKRRIYILFYVMQTDSQELKPQWLYPGLTSERHQDIRDLHLKA